MVVFEIGPVFIDLVATIFYVSAVWGTGVSSIVMATSAVYMTVFFYTRKREIVLRSISNDVEDDLGALKNESIANVDIVKYFSAEQYEVKRYNKGTLKSLEASFAYTCYDRVGDLVKDITIETGKILELDDSGKRVG